MFELLDIYFKPCLNPLFERLFKLVLSSMREESIIISSGCKLFRPKTQQQKSRN